jgi:DNA-binding transcriptional ArsR family regulator
MATYNDPRILRAIAHPTRNRILSELYAAGSLRAADVARLLDIPANQASFHLRQLAKYELVEEAPGEARDKRDRVWRLSDAEGISFRTKDVLAQPGGEAAFEVYRRSATAWGHHLVDLALSPDKEEGTEKSVSEYAVRLTPEEAREVMEEMNEIARRWRTRTQQAGDDERRTYSVYQLIQPLPHAAEAAEDVEGDPA